MQKINLKKTTKDKLYALLVELEAENERLKTELETKKLDFETEKMVLIRENETLKSLVQEQSEESCKAEEFADALAAALKDLDDARAANDKANAELKYLTEDIARAKALAEGYRAALDRCIEHPWKNLWRCIRGNECREPT